MNFDKPFRYDANSGKWSLELQKAPKGEFAQCGIKITIDPGFPTGEKGAFYQTKEPSGLMGSTVEVRCFDNLSSWTSAVTFDLATLFEKLIEVMPKNKMLDETFVLSESDVMRVKNKKTKNDKDKLYISNMCQAGFINKFIQKSPYKHPFLFCSIMEDDFIKFMKDFNKINFSNYKKLHYNETKIYNHQDKYTWDVINNSININVNDTLGIELDNGVQIMYPHTLFDKFDEPYKNRLERFTNNKNKEIYFIFRVRSFMSKKVVDEFYNYYNYKKILLFDEDVPFRNSYKENDNTKIIITSKEHKHLIDYLEKEGTLDKF